MRIACGSLDRRALPCASKAVSLSSYRPRGSTAGSGIRLLLKQQSVQNIIIWGLSPHHAVRLRSSPSGRRLFTTYHHLRSCFDQAAEPAGLAPINSIPIHSTVVLLATSSRGTSRHHHPPSLPSLGQSWAFTLSAFFFRLLAMRGSNCMRSMTIAPGAMLPIAASLVSPSSRRCRPLPRCSSTVVNLPSGTVSSLFFRFGLGLI